MKKLIIFSLFLLIFMSGYAIAYNFNVSNLVYTGKNFSVKTYDETAAGIDISTDGTKLYVLGTTSDRIYQFALSTAWDVSTASHVNNISILAQDGTAGDFDISSDGKTMYLAGTVTDCIYQYNLTTAWDITTATYTGNLINYSSTYGSIQAVNIINDTNFCFIDITSTIDTVYCRKLTVPLNLSGGSSSMGFFGINSYENTAGGLRWSSNGISYIIVGSSADLIRQFDVENQPFNASDTSYEGPTLNIASLEGTSTGLAISTDNKYAYVVGSGNDLVLQFANLTVFPELGCLYGPTVSSMQYKVNSAWTFPQLVNITGQTSTGPALNCSNQGTASGTLKISRNDTYTNVSDFCNMPHLKANYTPTEDMSGNGYNLTNTAVTFADNTGYFLTTTSNLYSTRLSDMSSTERTYSLWLYHYMRSDTKNEQILNLVNSSSDGSAGQTMGVRGHDASNAVQLTISANLSGYCDSVTLTSSTYPYNTWTHFVFVQRANQSSIYKNGVLDKNNTCYNFVWKDEDAGLTYLNPLIRLGNKDAGYGWNGTMRDVKIYNVALTDSQITQLYNNQTIYYGLVAWYPFYNVTNIVLTPVEDDSGNNNNLTNNGALFNDTEQSYVLDGVNDWLNFSSSFLGTEYDSFTLSYWLKINSNFSSWITPSLFTKYEFANYYYNVSNNNRMVAGGCTGNIYPTEGFPVDNWTLVTITRTSNATSCLTTLYWNTVSKGASSGLPPNNITYVSTSHFGKSNNYYPNVSINDIRVYNRALSTAEISQLYNNQTIRLGLTAWYRIDNITDLTTTEPNINVNTSYTTLGDLDVGESTGLWCARRYDSAIAAANRKSLSYSIILE